MYHVYLAIGSEGLDRMPNLQKLGNAQQFSFKYQPATQTRRNDPILLQNTALVESKNK